MNDGFLIQETTTPTEQWVQQLRQNFPSLKISILMGADSFLQLHTWTNAQLLLKQLNKVYCISRRKSEDEINTQLKLLKTINSMLECDLQGPHSYDHISSSDIRNKKARQT